MIERFVRWMRNRPGSTSEDAIVSPSGLSPVRWADHLVGCLWPSSPRLFASTSDEVGVPRDESTYMYAAQKLVSGSSAWG